jgi:hypothetical protein
MGKIKSLIMAIILQIEPVHGAAKYFAAIDPETNKPSIYMETTDNYLSVIDTARTMETARRKATSWQQKENRSVLKSKTNK